MQVAAFDFRRGLICTFHAVCRRVDVLFPTREFADLQLSNVAVLDALLYLSTLLPSLLVLQSQ
jgi:hypothetical protein